MKSDMQCLRSSPGGLQNLVVCRNLQQIAYGVIGRGELGWTMNELGHENLTMYSLVSVS